MPYLIVLLVVVVIVMISCVNVVPQAHAYVVERLGGYQATWDVGRTGLSAIISYQSPVSEIRITAIFSIGCEAT